MEGRLSNSVLLRQIIPKVKPSIDGPTTIKEVCSTRVIQPVELIATQQQSKNLNLPMPEIKKKEEPKEESKITKELIDKLNKLKESSEFGNIVKGSSLGLTAYQKPKGGIPLKDLSRDLQIFINRTNAFINKPSDANICYGQVEYNQVTKKINFYSPFDKEHKNIIGQIDAMKFPTGGVIDKVLDLTSNNAIANSTVTKTFNIVKGMIPDITVSNETLNIEKE